MQGIKDHYYSCFGKLNHFGIIPKGNNFIKALEN
jgi:hypothetical protein